MSVSQTTVTTSATLILAANSRRQSVVITNVGEVVAYYGPDDTITSSNAPHIARDGTFTEDSGGTRVYMGPFYAITEASTADIRVWERER